MASSSGPTAAERSEETVGEITYVRTDPDLPPVAIIDRSAITTKHKIIFGVIALLGAISWAMIAFFRGETVNAVWFVIAAVCTYLIGYRFYARLIEMKIVRPRDDVATPPRCSRTPPTTCRPTGECCSATTSPPSQGRAHWSGRCWPCRWATC